MGVAFAVVADLVAFLVLLAGEAPSISATSCRLQLDPPLASLDLPGPPSCLFPVINLLNGVVGALKSVAQPVCDALTPVICSYRTQYMYAAIVLVCSLALGLILLKFGRWHINVSCLYVLPSIFSISSTVLISTFMGGNCTCLIISRKTSLLFSFLKPEYFLRSLLCLAQCMNCVVVVGQSCFSVAGEYIPRLFLFFLSLYVCHEIVVI